ncbi:MAG TPA: gluconokinase [Methylomirabilota bacterium]|jgi:gluconokinase
MALDVGTSSARAAMYDTAGRALPDRFHQIPYEATTTPDGGVEHDPARLLDAVAGCVDTVQRARGAEELLGVAVTTFWHGLLGFDASDRPVTPVYMWADTRAAREATILRSALDEPALHARTGCHLHSSYWPAKLRWLGRARPNETRRVARWGSFGEYLELELFGAAATSVSMASATGLFDQDGCRWDAEAMAAAGVDERQLFPLCDRAERRTGLRTRWARRWPKLGRVPWFPAVGDGAAGNVGSDCTDGSRIALNVGTSAAMRVVGPAVAPPMGLWRYRIDRRLSLVGGATSEGGNVYAWLADVLKLPPDATVEAALADALPDAHGLTVLPFLAGERAPGWHDDRRATISGLSLHTSPVHVLQAGLEAVALRLAVIHALLAPLAQPGAAIVASGGALTHVRGWTQMIADAIGHPVTASRASEATSRGAAVLALQSLGVVRDLTAVQGVLGETFAPVPARHARYRAALARQRALDTLLSKSGQG